MRQSLKLMQVSISFNSLFELDIFTNLDTIQLCTYFSTLSPPTLHLHTMAPKAPSEGTKVRYYPMFPCSSHILTKSGLPRPERPHQKRGRRHRPL